MNKYHRHLTLIGGLILYPLFLINSSFIYSLVTAINLKKYVADRNDGAIECSCSFSLSEEEKTVFLLVYANSELEELAQRAYSLGNASTC
jgi:hypothetical protein